MAPVLATVHSSARLTIAVAPPLFVTVWSQAPALDDMEVLDAHQRRAVARAGGRCLNLAWLRPQAIGTLPSDELRVRTRRMLQELGGGIAANAQVVDVAGFMGAAVRMLLTSLGVLTRPPHPTQVFSSVEAGLDWLAHRAEAPPTLVADVPALAAAIRALV